MTVTRVKWHNKGFYDLRRAPGVVTDLVERAERIAAAANDRSGLDSYAVGHQQGRKRPQGRYRATVITSNFKAQLDNARNNTLIEVLGEGA